MNRITSFEEAGEIFSRTCDDIASQSVTGEDIASPSVEEG